MGKLLKFELRKIITSKFFYVGLIILLAIAGISGFAFGSFTGPGATKSLQYLLLQIIPQSGLSSLILVIIIIYISTDFSNLAIRNVVARGFSREKIFASKLIMSIALVLVYIVSFIAFCYLSFKVFIPELSTETVPYFGKTLSAHILVLVLYGVFAFATGIILRKIASSMAFTILVPSLISGILVILTSKIKAFQDAEIMKYWFDSFQRFITMNVPGAVDIAIKGSINYICVFIVISYLVWRKSEV